MIRSFRHPYPVDQAKPLVRWLTYLTWLFPILISGQEYQSDIKPLFKSHCYRCHAGDQAKSGYRLDTAIKAIAGGDRGPAIIPGNAAASLISQALRGTHPQLSPMPYRDKALSPPAIESIEAWINAGAPHPDNEIPDPHIHWAFRPLTRPILPEIDPRTVIENPIDLLVRSRIETSELIPSPPAKPEILIRRLYLDLLGLLPSPQEIDDYLGDYSSNATERLIDRLLSSPHFGERWGRHWLDLARYADSNGYSIDAPRSIWRYRDYVINAINLNLPFNQFVTEQLAGDLLAEPTTDQLIATGFHRNTQINQEGGIDKEQFRIESVVDRVATTGTAFLGLTIACAQCHDHKFDPITQREYYQFFAFFNNQEEPTLNTPMPGERAAQQRHQDAIIRLERAIKESESKIQERIFDWEKFLSERDLQDLPRTYRLILTKPRELRSTEESQQLFEHFREENQSYQALKKERAELGRKRPRLTHTMILRERKSKRTTHIHIKGDFTRQGEPVFPGTPRALNPFPGHEDATRLDLAHWLTSNQNPLLARVTVNRIWQQYFGRGIVETENDFGTQGSPPSHPHLLDWLAVELIENGWNLKALHKKILMSQTYQQSSRLTPKLAAKDPDNRLFARQSRMRLESEIIRDVALSAAGLLSHQMGGPGVHPPQPEGVMGLGQVQRRWQADSGENRFRRGLYTFFFRATPHPALTVFDSPDAFSACSRRIRSNTPLQALTLLNDPAFFEIAQRLALRIIELDCTNDADRIREAFRLCLSRYPTRAETRDLLNALQPDHAGSPLPPEAKGLLLARILLNLDETIARE